MHPNISGIEPLNETEFNDLVLRKCDFIDY